MLKLLWILVPAWCFFAWQPHRPAVNIWLAGDSTMQPYDTSRTPQRGWGQELSCFFDDDVIIKNKARGGRSTKTFMNEGLWKQIIDSVNPGDWVFIQFGHNDHSSKPERHTSPEQYQENLRKMVTDVLEKKAHPVLLTPIAMRTFDRNGQYYDGHGSYPDKVRKLAEIMHIPIIDLDKLFGESISRLGDERSKLFFMNFGPGIYPSFPNGDDDNTHLREPGARYVALLTVKEIQRLDLKDLVKHIRLNQENAISKIYQEIYHLP